MLSPRREGKRQFPHYRRYDFASKGVLLVDGLGHLMNRSFRFTEAGVRLQDAGNSPQ